jgi:hypothetical protein
LVCPQNTLSMYTMQSLRHLRRVNYATWIMDNNWVRRPPNGDWTYSPADAKILDHHLKDATTVFTISQSMGQHFKEYFRIDSEELFAPSPQDHPSPSANTVSPKKLGYFGNLHAWPVDALVRLAPLLKDSGYTLDIYSYAKLPPELKVSEITLMPPLPADEVASRMSVYAAVLLPMGFSDATAAYSRFNIATKMAECLSSRTVTLAIGPDDAAMIRYLRKHQVGLTLSHLQPSALLPILQKISSSEERRHVIRDQSAHVARHLTLQITANRFAQVAGLTLS